MPAASIKSVVQDGSSLVMHGDYSSVGSTTVTAKITIGGVTTSVVATKSAPRWTATFTGVAAGDYTTSVLVADTVGSATYAGPAMPVTAVPAAPTLSVASGSNPIPVSGTGVPGYRIDLQIDGGSIAPAVATVTAEGNWQSSVTLTNGSRTVAARQVDTAAQVPPAPFAIVLTEDPGTDTAKIEWSQSGSVTEWQIRVKLQLAQYTAPPNYTVVLASGAAVTLANLPNANAIYKVQVIALSDGIASSPAEFQFTTADASTARKTYIYPTPKATATVAALAAAEGSRDAAFLDSLIASIGSGAKLVAVMGGTRTSGGTDKVTEHISGSITRTGKTLFIPSAATLDSGAAAAIDSTWWYDVRTSGGVPMIRIPLDPEGVGGDYHLSADTQGGAGILRPAPMPMILQTPAFDAPAVAAGLTAAALIADMNTPWDVRYQEPAVSGFGDGRAASGNIAQVSWNEGTRDLPAYDTQVWQDPNMTWDNAWVSWLVACAGVGHYDNNSWLMNLYDFVAFVYRQSVGAWQVVPGSNQTNPVFANYVRGGLDATGQQVVGTTQQWRAPDGTPLYKPPSGNFMVHNAISWWQQAVPSDILSIHVRVTGKLVPAALAIPNSPAFDISAAQVLLQSGFDIYPRPLNGQVVGCGQSRGIRLTDQAQTIAFTHFRDDAGLLTIATPKDPSLLASHPVSETWLRAHLPPGYTA